MKKNQPPRGPTEEQWAELRKAAASVKIWTKILPPGANSLDKTKYDLCRRLLVYMRENDLSQRELAKKLGVVESRVSEAVHYHIGKISLERLYKYHMILDPKFSMKVV